MLKCNHCVHARKFWGVLHRQGSFLYTVHANKRYLTLVITYLPIDSILELYVFVPKPSSASCFSSLRSCWVFLIRENWQSHSTKSAWLQTVEHHKRARPFIISCWLYYVRCTLWVCHIYKVTLVNTLKVNQKFSSIPILVYTLSV